jgi:hypothetical protein
MGTIPNALPLLIKVVDAAKAAIPAGTAAYAEFQALSAKVNAFRDEGRDPTVEEFRELQAATDALTDRLEAANARLNPSN